jgi:hypothetical protein
MNETEETIRIGDPMPRLSSVSYHGAYEIVASWLSGPRKGKADVVDLAPVVLTYKVYRPLRDNTEMLKSVHLLEDGAAIAWGEDDAIDMAATTVERLAEETMGSADFRAWLDRHKFTYDAASAQLGISRRLVAYYAGKRHVPRYIALACRYLDGQPTGFNLELEEFRERLGQRLFGALTLEEARLYAVEEARLHAEGLRHKKADPETTEAERTTSLIQLLTRLER